MKKEINMEYDLNTDKSESDEMVSIFYEGIDNNQIAISDYDSNFGAYNLDVNDTTIIISHATSKHNTHYFKYTEDGDCFSLCNCNNENGLIRLQRINSLDNGKYLYETILSANNKEIDKFSNIIGTSASKNLCREVFKQNMPLLNQIMDQVMLKQGRNISEALFNSKAVQELNYEKIYKKIK